MLCRAAVRAARSRHVSSERVSRASLRWLSSGSLPPDPSLETGSSALEAASDALSVASASSSAAAEPWGPLHACMAGLDAVHSTLGLPWWATLSLLAVSVRGVMFPVALKGMRAGGALSLLPEAQAAARRQWEAGGGGRRVPGVDSEGAPGGAGRLTGKPGTSGSGRRGAAESIKSDREPGAEDGEATPQDIPRKGPPLPLVVHHLDRLRLAAGLPHPGWVLGAPLLQVPFFVAGMATARGLAATHWPGLEVGGLAWFTDLTLPALELGSVAAPMGSLGLVLPAAIILSISSVLDAALRVPGGEAGQGDDRAALARFALPYVRLAIDIGLVPLFIIALQVPQAALCYWLTSSGITLLQGKLLRSSPAARRALGLEPGHGTQRAPAAATAAMAATPKPKTLEGRPQPAARGQLSLGLRRVLVEAQSGDEGKLFERAAELVAARQPRAAREVLLRVLELAPRQPSAAFALGQISATRKAWDESERWYAAAAQWHEDPQLVARSWFGAGVAAKMQGEPERALPMFAQTVQTAQTDDLKARALVAQASVHQGLGEVGAAIDVLREAAQYDDKVEAQFIQPLLQRALKKK
ncbi:OXA1 [Auxenochlorella protothecoides x Auxenochlorella symbiontica]